MKIKRKFKPLETKHKIIKYLRGWIKYYDSNEGSGTIQKMHLAQHRNLKTHEDDYDDVVDDDDDNDDDNEDDDNTNNDGDDNNNNNNNNNNYNNNNNIYNDEDDLVSQN